MQAHLKRDSPYIRNEGIVVAFYKHFYGFETAIFNNQTIKLYVINCSIYHNNRF